MGTAMTTRLQFYAISWLRMLAASCLAFVMTGCGGLYNDDAAPTLVSIQIAPVTISKAVGQVHQYMATGIYSSGVSQDITANVTWTSSSTPTVTIDATGKAKAIALGSSLLTASLNKVTSSGATLTVIPAELVSIKVSPLAAQVEVQLTLQFTATGLYTDGTSQDITPNVNWTSSDLLKATIDTKGLALAGEFTSADDVIITASPKTGNVLPAKATLSVVNGS
jgi:Bacterial Ig-like domain (group 2)